MSQKYYAVRVGKVPGVYTTWDECRAQTDGFAGAEYKAFRTKKEATAYVRGEAAGDDGSSLVLPEVEPGAVVAYVDGSFDARTGRYGYGCVLVTHGATEPVFLSGSGADEEAKSARNVAGELLGTMNAVRWAAQNGCKTVHIYHDYSGIALWYERAWKTESAVAKKYVAYMDKYRPYMNITFCKVAAHTGVSLNEKADRLAKEALGL